MAESRKQNTARRRPIAESSKQNTKGQKANNHKAVGCWLLLAKFKP